jgi:hypothetical protein
LKPLCLDRTIILKCNLEEICRCGLGTFDSGQGPGTRHRFSRFVKAGTFLNICATHSSSETTLLYVVSSTNMVVGYRWGSVKALFPQSCLDWPMKPSSPYEMLVNSGCKAGRRLFFIFTSRPVTGIALLYGDGVCFL